jgi:esterase/lipase
MAAFANLTHQMRSLTPKSISRFAGPTLALALAACASVSEFGPRHASSGRAVPMPSAAFGEYVASAEVAIAQSNRAIGPALDAAVVKDRAPFELRPRGACARTPDGRYEKAALLIHDLGGTPYEMRDLARAFADACHLVRAILLPGHGTVPGDLLDTDYRQWVAAMRSAVATFEGKAARLVLVGFGLGATLAIDYAMSDAPPPGAELEALVLLAPALGEETPYAWLRAPGDHGQLIPGRPWVRLLPDYDPVRYESLPRNALTQRSNLVEQVMAREAALPVPVFLVLSADDTEVDAGAARAWFCQRLAGPRRLIWYARTPAPSNDCAFVSEKSSAEWPDILDLSHVALPIAPDNPRYGADGGYPDCSHYYWENSPNWLICVDVTKTVANADLRYGEITVGNLERHLVRRLTYNPDFDAMTGAALAFVADPGG